MDDVTKDALFSLKEKLDEENIPIEAYKNACSSEVTEMIVAYSHKQMAQSAIDNYFRR